MSAEEKISYTVIAKGRLKRNDNLAMFEPDAAVDADADVDAHMNMLTILATGATVRFIDANQQDIKDEFYDGVAWLCTEAETVQ